MARDRLRVLDPRPQPLAQWDRLTANVGMAYLRSTSVHHLALDPDDLRRFGSRWQGLPVPPFAPTLTPGRPTRCSRPIAATLNNREGLRVAVIVNAIARAVKRARFMALLPYTSEHIGKAREEE